MDSPIAVRAREIRELQIQFSCDHESTELRSRTVSGGHIQRVYQCLKCGSATSRALSKDQALLESKGKELPPFDDDILDRWASAKKTAFEQIEAKYGQFIVATDKTDRKSTDWWKHYNDYLLTPQWLEKKRKVLLRAQGMCEGCRDAEATTVHHTTYAHVGEEFLFELLALCDPCHKRLHGEG